MKLDELLRELRGPLELKGLAVFVEKTPDRGVALRALPAMLELAGAATIRRRNRLSGQRLFERACLGALGHAQGELSEKLRAEGVEP